MVSTIKITKEREGTEGLGKERNLVRMERELCMFSLNCPTGGEEVGSGEVSGLVWDLLNLRLLLAFQ